jgi:aquaporin Z
VKPWDALFYMIAQFAGGVLGVLGVVAVLGSRFTAEPVRYVATRPGVMSLGLAFAGEVVIACVMMLMVLVTTNSQRWMRRTGLLAGCLVATYITFEGPISGMSLNPARSFASALPGGVWDAIWIYFTAPPLGMLLAVELHRRLSRGGAVHCAKLNHHTTRRCIFCGYGMKAVEENAPQTSARLNPPVQPLPAGGIQVAVGR